MTSPLLDGERLGVRVPRHWIVLVRGLLGALLLALAGCAVPIGVVELGGPEDVAVTILLGVAAVAGIWALTAWCRWTSQTLLVTDRRVLLHGGLLRRWSRAVSLDRIQNVVTEQGLPGRVLRYGTVRIATAGAGEPGLVISGVPAPTAVREQVFAEMWHQRVRGDRTNATPSPILGIVSSSSPAPPAGGQRSPNARALALLGFMACGKTTVARLVAERTGLPFRDLDDAIVEVSGVTIPQLFRARGEAAFRQLEASLLSDVLEPGTVVALGGGTPIGDANWRAIRERAVTVWLDAPLDALLARADRDARPVLGGRTDAEVAALYQSRLGRYQEADYRVDALRAPDVVAEEVCSLWRG
jgi:shikimate kinase/membrane protein YdbS with pleckstrin-like domain